MLLVNVIDQLFQLDFEHSGYQIRFILRLLSWQQRSLDFRPLGIVSECNKRIRATGPFVDCHGILIILNHVTWNSYERRWQNDPLSDGNNVIVTYSDGVLKALIKIYTKLSDLGADTSSDFVRQLHKHPQCIAASIGHLEATQCYQCLDVEVDNRKIQPLSHCDAFYDAQIPLHGLQPNPHQHPAK
jgi:hypothetical protein